jgi:sterol desaturase/sphingolipid hydroxylase (fatty acid hydroxylase superfamily)
MVGSIRNFAMRLGKFGYYCEFFLCPAFAGLLAAWVLTQLPAADWLDWALGVGVGVVAWTIVEYLMHRFVFHRVPFIRDMHEAHHQNHEDLVGTPAWLSLPALAAAGLGLVGVFGFPAGSALTTGLTLGYWWYISVHHIVHHWRLPTSGYAFRLKRRHALHHHFDESANFGVTTGLWDTVFGTTATVGRRSGRAAQ